MAAMAYFIVFLGAGVGGGLRHLVNTLVTRLAGTGFPWGIMVINVTGSLVMGLAAGWLAFKSSAGWSQHARLFAMTGILGGYTTFSAFSLDVAVLWERGQVLAAALYIAGSVALSILGLFAGLAIVRAVT
jgi:CrcB protein